MLLRALTTGKAACVTPWGLGREVEDVDQMPGGLNACAEHGFCSAIGHLWNLEIRPTQTCFGEAVPHLLGALQGRGLWASSDDSGMWQSGRSYESQVNSIQRCLFYSLLG